MDHPVTHLYLEMWMGFVIVVVISVHFLLGNLKRKKKFVILSKELSKKHACSTSAVFHPLPILPMDF